MATTSIAPAAKFLNVSLCKHSSGKNLNRKKGQRELELTAELRVSRGHPNEPADRGGRGSHSSSLRVWRQKRSKTTENETRERTF